MKSLPSEKTYGPRGPATIGLSGKNLTISMYNPETKQPTGDNFQFPFSDAPIPAGVKLTPGDYFVSVSRDGDKLYAIRPLNATVIARFLKFATPNGNSGATLIPSPRRDTSPGRRRDGSSYPRDELKFTALMVVDDGPWKGLEIPGPFIYARRNQDGSSNGFCDDGNGNVAIRGSGKDFQKLIAFLESAGIWGREYAFSSNLLPLFESELQKENRPFMVVIRNGWPESYAEAYIPGSLKKSSAASKSSPKKKKK